MAIAKKKITKAKALKNIKMVQNDCSNFEDWDTDDRDNFEGMSDLLEEVKSYIDSLTVKGK